MKKLFYLLLIVACIFTLGSCTLPFAQTCTVHFDNDNNLQCDKCGELVPCTVHRDTNKDLKCDKCQADVPCAHVDDDNDGKCDVDVCDHVFCEHEYSDEYSYNKSYHYFEPTCGCDTEPKDKERHEDEDNDGICDVCEWNYNHRHTYAVEWSHDATKHWHEPTCDHDIAGKALGTHEDDDNDGVCDVCLWDYDHKHTYDSAWSHDDNNHWHAVTCDHDIEVKGKAAHADSNNDGICDGCSWDYQHEHTFNENVWKTDEDNHWHAPTCGHDIPGKDFGAHVDLTDKDGEAGDDGHCDVCDKVVCDNHEQDLTTWQYDATTHWHPSKCGHDRAAMEAAGHTLNEDGTQCTTCGYETGHVHQFPDEYEFDGVNHWKKATCHTFIETEPVAHTDTNLDGICEVCENQFCNHTYSTDWSHDNENHWHATNCGHVNAPGIDKAAHVDADNNGICDGCNWNYDHEHQYATEWNHDKDYHWHDVACTHTVPVIDKGVHEDKNNDGLCDGCNWNYGHEHTYDESKWAYDLENHFYAPSCTHDVPGKNITPHTDENNDGFCEVCLNQYCTHEFSEDWSHDTETHWHATVCEHSSMKDQLGNHEDKNNDGLCDVCSWDYDHTHTYATEWNHDKDYHWHDVTCTHDIPVADKAEHKDENNDGICDGCEWNYDHTHEYATEWNHDNDYHWHDVTCTHDIPVADKAEHKDENNDGICDGCEWNYDHEHTYEAEYSYDKNYHWYAPSCKHNIEGKDKAAHIDANGDGNCEVCLKQFCTHEYKAEWTFDGKYHWHESACGHELPPSEKAEHVDTENNDGYCDVCERSMTCEHTYDESNWISNETHHWHAPTCGHDENDTADSRVAHTDVDGDLKCDICEAPCDVDVDDGEIDEDGAIKTEEHVFAPQ